MNTESSTVSITQTMPALKKCDGLSLQDGDVVIHAPGFEDRTMAIASLLVSPREGRAILLDYLPANPDNRLKEVRQALLTIGIKTGDSDVLTYNRFEPGDFEERLRARLVDGKAQRAVVDISTMSKLEIMLVLHVCYQLDLAVLILYCEAHTYGPSRHEFEEAKAANKIHQPTLQIYTGVHGVVRISTLSSVAMQGQPTAAIVFMSFNDALTQVLLNTVYPSRLFLVNGRPPVHQWREEATAWIHEQVRKEWESDNPMQADPGGRTAKPLRTASTLDYRETVYLLLQLYWELSANHRILLAPAGSKLQAVGSYLVKALHPDIHIEYPSPEGFFSNYSSGIGSAWLLDLGRLSGTVSAISEFERRKYLEIPMGHT